MKIIEIDSNVLARGMRGGHGMKKAQALALGIGWPLKKGWKHRVIGKVVDESTVELFRDLKPKMGTKKSLALAGFAAAPKEPRRSKKNRKAKRSLPVAPVPVDETAMSFDEWNSCGYRIKKGEKASSFDINNVPQFTIKQVVKF